MDNIHEDRCGASCVDCEGVHWVGDDVVHGGGCGGHRGGVGLCARWEAGSAWKLIRLGSGIGNLELNSSIWQGERPRRDGRDGREPPGLTPARSLHCTFVRLYKHRKPNSFPPLPSPPPFQRTLTPSAQLLILAIIYSASAPCVFLVQDAPPTPPTRAAGQPNPSFMSLMRAMVGREPRDRTTHMTIRQRIDFAVLTLLFGVLVAA